MSPADLGRRWPAAKAFTLAAVLATSLAAVLLLSATIVLAAPPRPAAAAGALTVTMDRSLTLVNETPGITVSGEAIAALSSGDTLAVRIAGPAALSQVAQTDPTLPDVGSFTVAVDSLPSVARPSPSELHLPVPLASLPASPGAYRITVDLRSADVLAATGSTWLGRVALRSTPLDLAFVWRAALGIHRGPDGSFFDTTLEQACAPGAATAPGARRLRLRIPKLRPQPPAPQAQAPPPRLRSPAVFRRCSRFPANSPIGTSAWVSNPSCSPNCATWRTATPGPVRSGAGTKVVAGDPAAKNAAAVLAGLAGLADSSAIEVAVSPYASPDLGLLATQGWRDGFEQVQLGKQEVVQTMSLALPPSGAWSPGLDLTTGSLGDYGEASIDHVLVDAALAADLNEPIAAGAVAVRAHDDKNDRVTLVLADSELRKLMAPPWDPGVLFAGIAAVLASSDRDALVLTPSPDFTLAPGEYLDAIGEELQKDVWIRTQTMTGLLRAHPPGTRPVLLSRDPVPLSGYIGETIFSAVQSAHAAIDDLAVVADPASLPLENARRSLYLAESRWWSRPGASPDQASAGLGYAVEAQTVAKGELDKIKFTGTKPALILGHAGQVKLVARNGADYAVTVEVRLAGAGLRFPQGDVVKVRLEAGGNEIAVPVVGTSSSRELTATLVAGSSVLDKTTTSLRFVTLTDILPWAGLAVLVIVVAVLAILYLRSRKVRRTA